MHWKHPRRLSPNRRVLQGPISFIQYLFKALLNMIALRDFMDDSGNSLSPMNRSGNLRWNTIVSFYASLKNISQFKDNYWYCLKKGRKFVNNLFFHKPKQWQSKSSTVFRILLVVLQEPSLSLTEPAVVVVAVFYFQVQEFSYFFGL